jgi:hypothetical protein
VRTPIAWSAAGAFIVAAQNPDGQGGERRFQPADDLMNFRSPPE